MSRLLQNLLPLSLLAFALSGCTPADARTSKNATGGKGHFASECGQPPAPNDTVGKSGLDSLCDNHYNRLRLPIGKFEQVKAIIALNKKSSVKEIKARLNTRKITLYEASWGLYYLGQKSLNDKDYKHFVKYLTIAADDYLNPWAMTLLAKVYFYDKAEWKKQFPDSEITTDKDLERSYTYLSLALVLSGEIEKEHQDNFLLTGVANGGLAMKDTFEGTGISGFDARKTLQKHQRELLGKAEAYKQMYEKGK